MKYINQFARFIKRKVWTIIVSYMIGIHNFYKEEDRTPEDITITIEEGESERDNSEGN